MVGELVRNFSFFGGGVCRVLVLNCGAEVVGVTIFCWQKSSWYVSWWGNHQNGGKIIWRGNGGEFPRKGLSQLSPCGEIWAKQRFLKTHIV